MRAANVFAGFVVALWSGLLRMGSGLMNHMASSHYPGVPAPGQIRAWVDAPIAMLALLFCAVLFFNFVKRSPLLLTIFALIAIGPMFLYLIDLVYASSA
jgi:hypothetical protein